MSPESVASTVTFSNSSTLMTTRLDCTVIVSAPTSYVASAIFSMSVPANVLAAVAGCVQMKPSKAHSATLDNRAFKQGWLGLATSCILFNTATLCRNKVKKRLTQQSSINQFKLLI